MDFVLSRDHALTVPLLSTYDTAALLSKDGGEIKVPLAPLLGASPLVRSMVAEAHLHPGIHGPLILSFEVASDILECVGHILGLGESNIEERKIIEVKKVLKSLGVEAVLSQSRINIEGENVSTNEEDINLEIVFEQMSDDESDESGSDVNEAKDNYLIKKCSVNIEKLAECPDLYHSNKQGREKTVYRCSVCEYSAPSISLLKRHMSRHSGKKPYKCTICNFSCSISSSLKRHQRIHTTEKPYKCPICNFSCSHSDNLKTHIRIHTGEKPFKCKICNFSSSQSDNLKRHIRIHTGEKPYKCKICSYSCSDPSNIKVHNRIHTGEKPHTCEICDLSFSRLSQLRKHGRTHTEENDHGI